MRITLYNGNDGPAGDAFDQQLDDVAGVLQERGHDVEIIDLRPLKLHKCIGCFGCWVKTPGECVLRDDFAVICSPLVNRDLVVHASPLRMGFVTALMRMASERMIPVLMPYMELLDGEVRHTKRYPGYARMGLLYAEEADTDAEDLDILRDIYQQMSAEIHQDLTVFKSLTGEAREVADAFDSF